MVKFGANNKSCAICHGGNKPDRAFGFPEILRDLEIEGKYAHPTCVMDEQAKLRAYEKRYGKK